MKNLNQKFPVKGIPATKINNQKYNTKIKSVLVYFVVGFIVVVTSFSFLFVVSKVQAATGVNRQINFQGKLVDNNGLNVADSTYTVVFSLYNVSSNGTNVWTETDSVTTKAGVFQVQLGGGTPLPDSVYFNQDNLYLGIKVGADAEMTPRIRFTAVPYALNSASLDGVVATQSATGFNLQGGTGSTSTVSFTTAAGALTLQPGVAEGLTIDTNGANALSLGTSSNAISFGGGNNPTYTFNGGGLTTLGGGLTINGTSEILGNGSDATIQTKSNSNSGLTLLSQGQGNITLGQNAGNGNVVISPNAGGQAALIVKDLGTGDLFTASAGATTKFTVDKSGDIIFAGGQTNANSTINSLATSATNYTLPSQGGTFCLTTNNCNLAQGTNFWQSLTTGAIEPFNTTVDLLLGGSSTSSARFAFINNTGTSTTPTASISANSNNIATSLTGNGVLGTTNGQSLTLGTTGNINFFNTSNVLDKSGNLTLAGQTGINLAGNGADLNFTGTGVDTISTANNSDLALMSGGTGEVGVNVSSNLLATFDVRGNSGTDPVASVSGATTNAAEIVDQSGTGDLFTASKSGATKFTINNDGTVALDTTNYNACGVLATDANGNIYCSTAGAKETIASTYTITAPSGSNLHISFTGPVDAVPSSSSGTLSFPANTTKMTVELKGAGGGGGSTGATSANKGAGGGGEGGYSNELITNIATDYYVKVGGGGLGGASGGTNNGAQGTSTCFGTNSSDACSSSLLSATGGSGGGAVNSAVSGKGGTGGSGSGGDLSLIGAAGLPGGSVATVLYGGGGGGIGGAVNNNTSNSNGTNGSNGGGGSGALSTTTGTNSGGNGGNGYITFTIYTNSNLAATPEDNWYQYASGVLAPDSLTTDLLLGSNATASAQFGFLNVDGGTPTASISAGSPSLGAAYLTGNGVLQTTNNQTLTIGGSTTGNIIINPSSNSLLGIGTTTPHADLDVNGGQSTIAAASISGQTSFAAMVVNNSGVGDLFTASKSGATKFTIHNDGTIQYAGTNNVLSTLASAATSVQTWILPNATGTLCVSGQACATSGTVGYLQRNAGAIAPGLITDDLLLGGTATTSAKFAVINMAGGTPVASLSAGTAGGAYMTASGVIQTTANQTLSLGGSTTGNIILNSAGGNYVGIDTTNPLATLDVRNATGLNGGTVAVASISGQTSYAALTAINNGFGDLFTASKSGATKFTILNNGNISWAGTNSVLSTLASAATAAQTWTLPNATGTLCISGQSCATSGTVGYLQRNAGAIAPSFITDDLLLGSTATTSAKFAVINMAGGTPVASLSAGVAGGAYMTASGTIQTTANQTLILGGSTTGNIIINPTSTSMLGIGTTTPHADLDVAGGPGTIPAASVSAQSSYATLVTNNSGTGDLFTASKSGATKFTILNNGDIQANNYNTDGGVLYTNSTGVIQQSGSGSDTNCLVMSGTTPTWGSCITGGGSDVTSSSVTGGTSDVAGTNIPLNIVMTIATVSATPTTTTADTYLHATVDLVSASGTDQTISLSLRKTNCSGPVLASDTTNVTVAINTPSQTMQLEAVDDNPGAATSSYVLCESTTGAVSIAGKREIFAQIIDNVGPMGPQGATGGDTLWQLLSANGTLSPTSITPDLLIGSSATSSAKFGFLNVDGGTPTASISAGSPSLGAAYLTGNGVLQTTNNQTLTIGGSTTGNIIINPSSNSLLGIGTTTPHADLDLNGGAETIPVASIAGQTSFAAMVVNNTGAGDIFTASKSGATKFTVLSNGNLAFAGTNNVLSTINSVATTAQTWTLPNATGTLCLSTNNCGFASGTNEWQQINGAISPTTITDDILAGGTATASARFAVINMIGAGIPTASLSAGVNGGTYMTASGVIQTTANQSLSLGGTTTGNILLNPAAGNYVGIDTITPLASLDVRNATGLNGGTVAIASISGKTTNAGLVVDNSGKGDIFTASSSGLTRLVIAQSGAVGIGTRTPQAVYLDISENPAATFVPAKDFVDIGNAAGQEPTVDGVNAEQLTWFAKPASGNVSSVERINTTNNNTATAGQVNAMRIVATGAGGAINSDTDGLYIDGLANASKGTTGQYAIEIGTNWDSSIYGQGDLRINAGGNIIFATSSATTKIGIGTTAPLATLDVRGNSGTTPAASVEATSSFAAMVVNNSGKGDLFTASKSGATKFVINNAGKVGIGTSVPNYALDVQDSQSATAAAQIFNTSAGASAVGLQIKLGATGSIPATNRWINFMNGNGQILGKVRGNANGTTVAYDGNGGDFAEYFKKSPSAGDLNPGDLICQGTDGVEKCTNNGDGMLGVISDDAAFIGAGGHEDDPDYVLVGLVGQLRVTVASQSGSLKAGDPLTLSTTAGTVVKATHAGQIIGRALESYDPSTSTDNRVLTSISITWYDPMIPTDGNYDLLQNADLSTFDQQQNASSSGVLDATYTIKDGAGIAVTSTTAFAKATIANIQAGAIVAKEMSTDSLTVTTGNIMLGGQTLNDYIKGIVKQTLSERDQTRSIIATVNGLVTATQSAQLIQNMLDQKDLSATVSGMTVTGVLGADTINAKHIAGLTDLNAATVSAASISAQTITADTINVKHISGLDVLTAGLQKDDARITALENLVATPSASPTLAQEPAVSPTEGITVLSNATEQSSVASDLRVKGNGLIEGVLHIVGTLFANDFIANGVADFFGNVIFHSGVTFQQTPTFNSDTAGIAVVKKGIDHIDVKFSKAYDQTPVINASITTVSLTPTPSETPDQLQKRQDDMEKTLLADNIHFIITNKTTNGFTILLDKPAQEDIAFSWLALSVQNPVIFQSNQKQTPTPADSLSPSPIDTIMPSDATTSAGF